MIYIASVAWAQANAVNEAARSIKVDAMSIMLPVIPQSEVDKRVEAICLKYIKEDQRRKTLKMLLGIACADRLFAEEFVYEAFAKIKALNIVIYLDKSRRSTLDVDFFLGQVLTSMPSNYGYAVDEDTFSGV